MAEQTSGNRIEWCDIFKGLLILLVVVVHATYKFNHYLNQYAYQFGMQALFFISGYTSKARNKSLMEEIFTKFYRLVVPYYFINLIGISLFWALNQAGVLSVVSEIQYPASFGAALKALFSSSNTVYCDWLGAMWFLPTLFLATVLFKALARLFKRDLFLLLGSLGIFFLSIEMMRGGMHSYFLDLAGIAQVFMVFGYLAQKIPVRECGRLRLTGRLVLTGFLWWLSMRLGFRGIVKFPERQFNGAIDLLLPVWGTLLTITLAKLSAQTPLLRKPLVYLGRNSMGIMCFHLIGFKAAYLLLLPLGRIELRDMFHLIPWPELKQVWIPIAAISILFSLLLWNGLNRIPAARILLGNGNPAKVYKRLQNTGMARRLAAASSALFPLLREKAIKYRYLLLACCILALAGSWGAFLYRHSGKVNITFPYEGGSAVFQEGWFPQNDGEDYRWFSEQARLKIFLTNQRNLEIKGYIPEDIENVTYLSIKLNQTELCYMPASKGTLIELSLDISEAVSPYRNNILEIATDGCKHPGASDADQRALSANLSSILIY